jgi:tRNA(Ile2) C34 agmatinyltransferase TiaS
MDWSMWLFLLLFLWIVHRALLGLRTLIEPQCPRCGGRRWTERGSGEWACVGCATAETRRAA